MNLADLEAGLCFSAPMYLPAASGKKAYFHILNPEESGKTIYVERVEGVGWGTADFWTLRSYTASLSGSVVVCNANFGAGPGVAVVTQQAISSLIGNAHYETYRTSGREFVYTIPNRPVIELVPGRGLLVCFHGETCEATCTIDWTEK